MKIEKLEVSQHLDTRKLYEEVFSEDEKSFVDYYYQEKTKDNIIYVVREDDDIQAMLHLNPYTLWQKVYGRTFKRGSFGYVPGRCNIYLSDAGSGGYLSAT